MAQVDRVDKDGSIEVVYRGITNCIKPLSLSVNAGKRSEPGCHFFCLCSIKSVVFLLTLLSPFRSTPTVSGGSGCSPIIQIRIIKFLYKKADYH